MGKLRSGKSGATLDDALSCEQHLLRGKVMRIRRYIALRAVVLAASVSASFGGPVLGRDRRDAGKDRRQAGINSCRRTACYRQRHAGDE